jgi:transposase
MTWVAWQVDHLVLSESICTLGQMIDPDDPAGPFELVSSQLGALPVIDRFLERIGVAGTLERHLPGGNARTTLPAATAVGVLVRNLCVAREPIYGLAGWAAGFEPGLLGLEPGEAGLLNDDRVGRALDALFDADRASLLTELVLRAVREFEIDCSQLHNDSTSVVLHGDYTAADGRERGGKPTVLAARGHSKDHRPDLKQLVLILTVTADGAVPLTHRLAAGNTNDDCTHIDTWDELRALTGSPGFLYVADSKLCTRGQMSHIDGEGGRFVTVLPRTRREDGQLRNWMSTSTPEFTEAARRPGKRLGDPEQVWRVASAPFPSSEGHRIVWVHSTVKEHRDETARHERIQRTLQALAELNQRLAGPRARITTRVGVEDAATEIIDTGSTEQYVSFTVTGTIEESFRQEKRGRPGNDTRYRKLTKTRFQVTAHVDAEQIRHDAASDGCFPLISNDHQLTDTQVLIAYRYQPNLEKRHHQLKSVHDAAPVTLKSPARIEALFACQFIALLCCCLIERELRNAMTREQITNLPIYPEDRACTAPTAARVFDHLAPLQRHHLTRDRQTVQTFEPQLTSLQAQLLNLLDVPTSAYSSQP